MSADVPLPLWGPSAPGRGRVEGELKTQKMGVVSVVHRTTTISIFLSASKCSSIFRAQTCAHSGAEPSRSAKALLQGGPKSSKKNSNFWPFQKFMSLDNCYKYRHISSIRKNALYIPYPSVACVWTHRPRGSTGWSKKCDVIPHLGIMSRLPFLFSWASSSVVAYVGHRPTHILA